MPEAEIKKRGGAKRYRTIKVSPDKYIHVAVVPKAGPQGGHTVAGPVHEKKHSTTTFSKRKQKGGFYTVTRRK